MRLGAFSLRQVYATDTRSKRTPFAFYVLLQIGGTSVTIHTSVWIDDMLDTRFRVVWQGHTISYLSKTMSGSAYDFD